MTQLLYALAILSAYSSAQTGTSDYGSAIVYRTDFEKEADANYDGWPDHWTRRRGRGYPAYIPIQIVDKGRPSKKGNHCLEIRMDGGGAQLYVPSQPVNTQFSYLLESWVRIDGLKHDEVVFSISFYDAKEQLLETRESEPLRKADDWACVRLGPITPSSDQARTAILSIHVRPTAKADLKGKVYIDDLSFYRLPKMAVETNSEHNVYSDPDDVLVTCRVSGFTQTNPVVTFGLFDVHGKELAEIEQVMTSETPAPRRSRDPAPSPNTPSVPGGFAGSVTWKPPIKEPGFYRLYVATPGQPGLNINIVVVPPLDRGRNGEFGWTLPKGDQPLGMKTLPSLLSQVGVHWVKFPVWFTAEEASRAEAIASFAERLSTYNIKLVGILDQPPQKMKSLFGASDRLAAASVFENKSVWHPAVDPVMTRLSMKVRWWQLGQDYDTSFNSYADLNKKIREISDDFATFGQQVHVGLPWRVMEEPPKAENPAWSFLSYTDELPLTDAEIESYLATPSTSPSKRWVVLEPLSRANYSLESRAQDLVLRMLAAKATRASGVFIPQPFHDDHGVMNEDGSPTELLLPWRTTSMLIGGSEYLGTMKLPNGSKNQIFVKNDEAIMVVWNDQPTTEQIYCGEHSSLYDIWGKKSAPKEIVEDNHRRQEIPVGPMPVFVTGVNAAIAEWRMNFHFETTSIASEFGREQAVEYRFKNTMSQAVGGKITFQTPNVWRTDRASRTFKLSPGEELRDSLHVMLGPDASSGEQPIRVDFELTTDQNLQFSTYEQLQVGLDDIVVEFETRLDDQGNLIVEQHLTNNTEKVVSFNCMLFAPGRRREKCQVYHLSQGRTTNVFVLPNGHELLNKTLWLRAEEIGGSRILNDRVLVVE